MARIAVLLVVLIFTGCGGASAQAAYDDPQTPEGWAWAKIRNDEIADFIARCGPPEFDLDPDAKPDRYAVIYVGHSDDLSAERFPFQHPRAHCWIKRAGSRWKVYICTYEVPGGGRPHREQIARELTAIYQPRCNDQQYDQAVATLGEQSLVELSTLVGYYATLALQLRIFRVDPR